VKTDSACYVTFDADHCTGCTECVRICPTQAIRIRDNKPILLEDRCIGCGECIRTCRNAAISVSTCELKSLSEDQVSVAMVSPVLYSQFPGVTPDDVMLGMRMIGFDHVVDMSYFLEKFQYITEEFISRNRVDRDAPWPLISPICPVVLRLIACKFPSLVSHVLPIMRPVELMAQDIRSHLERLDRFRGKAITFYYIVPCATKMEPSKAHFLENEAYRVRALGFKDIYPELLNVLKRMKKEGRPALPPDVFDFGTTSNSLIWGLSGGEIADLAVGRTLAVSGLHETISYLEKIEMGLFQDIEYIEFRTCGEGCIGGILTSIDRYMAKRFIQKIVIKNTIVERRVYREELLRQIDEGRFSKVRSPSAMLRAFGVREDNLSVVELLKIEEILDQIRGKNCGACGYPSCESMAEDILRGRASISDCVEWCARQYRGEKSEKPSDNR